MLFALILGFIYIHIYLSFTSGVSICTTHYDPTFQRSLNLFISRTIFDFSVNVSSVFGGIDLHIAGNLTLSSLVLIREGRLSISIASRATLLVKCSTLDIVMVL